MKKFVSILSVVVVLLFVVFIIQNAENVDVKLLFWSLAMPKALLMILCLSVGFLFGTAIFGFDSKKSESQKDINT